MDLLIMIIMTAVVFFGLGAWMLWSQKHHHQHPQKQ